MAIYEMDLNPGAGIAVHSHPYAEIFYVISGHTDFLHIDEQGKVIRRAEEPAGFVRTIVERMERVDRDYQSVPPRQTVPILLLPSGGIG